VRRTLLLASISTLVLNLFHLGGNTHSLLRPDTSRAALVSLGQEYSDLQQWAQAIAEATDTPETPSPELARAFALQLSRIMEPLEADFEKTTAALSTDQLEQVLPLWERMVFAHAGFLLLQEEAAELVTDPLMEISDVHDLATQLSAVLDFAAEIQQLILDELTPTVPTTIRSL
jgi:hypothetical protein